MENYQKRMLKEFKELSERADKLWEFIHGEEFHTPGIHLDEQSDLIDQVHAMFIYKSILLRRIKRAGLYKDAVELIDPTIRES